MLVSAIAAAGRRRYRYHDLSKVVIDAARTSLPALSRRLDFKRENDRLLRSSFENESAADELLKPASSAANESAKALLRPMEHGGTSFVTGPDCGTNPTGPPGS